MTFKLSFDWLTKVIIVGIGVLFAIIIFQGVKATRRDKAVLIQTDDHRNIVVTPDNPTEFITQLNQKIEC